MQEEEVNNSLEHLNNDMMIELMIKIVNLIEYFCRQAKRKKNNLFL